MSLTNHASNAPNPPSVAGRDQALEEGTVNPARTCSRRTFLAAGVQAAAGAAAALSAAGMANRAASPEPSMSTPAAAAAGTAATDMPCGMIGKVRISRLLLGGNLVGGYMHSRDLKYVGSLFRAYVTEEKLLETFRLAEQHGINTVFETGAEYVRKYNAAFRGKMQVIPHIEVTDLQSPSQLRDQVSRLVDTGAVALYVWGCSSDALVEQGKGETLLRAIEVAKGSGLPIGVGSHSLQVPMVCEKLKVPCDFYVKTLHTDNYASATPKERRVDFMWQHSDQKAFWDNMWCIDPEETVAFFKSVTKPWLAFKVLAAGAIPPREGFLHAFRNGADFIAVGMFDFQVKENAELTTRILRRTHERERPWMA